LNQGFQRKTQSFAAAIAAKSFILRTATSYRQRIAATTASSIEFSLVSAIFTPKAGKRFHRPPLGDRIAI
jgi:hypothetical protein